MRPKSTGYGDEVTPLQALNITSIAVNDYLCDVVPLSLEIIQASHAKPYYYFFARYNRGGGGISIIDYTCSIISSVYFVKDYEDNPWLSQSLKIMLQLVLGFNYENRTMSNNRVDTIPPLKRTIIIDVAVPINICTQLRMG